MLSFGPTINRKTFLFLFTLIKQISNNCLVPVFIFDYQGNLTYKLVTNCGSCHVNEKRR